MGKRFVISDLHIGHEGALNFRREFKTLHEMHEKIIDSWNTTVRNKNDVVLVLGDVCLSLKHMGLLDKLTGEKCLIKGNHDTFSEAKYRKYFTRIEAMWTTSCPNNRLKLLFTHIPVHPWELFHPERAGLEPVRGRHHVNVHGHKHGQDFERFGKLYLDVSCEKVDYKPMEVDEIIRRADTWIHHENHNN